jgi:hypothetical protein
MMGGDWAVRFLGVPCRRDYTKWPRCEWATSFRKVSTGGKRANLARNALV